MKTKFIVKSLPEKLRGQPIPGEVKDFENHPVLNWINDELKHGNEFVCFLPYVDQPIGMLAILKMKCEEEK